MTRLSVLISSLLEEEARPSSTMINPFSKQEWAVSQSISDLIQTISSYLIQAERKPAKTIIGEITKVVTTSKFLAQSLLETVPKKSEQYMKISGLKLELNVLLDKAVTQIQALLIKSNSATEDDCDNINDILVDIATTTNNMLEIVLKAETSEIGNQPDVEIAETIPTPPPRKLSTPRKVSKTSDIRKHIQKLTVAENSDDNILPTKPQSNSTIRSDQDPSLSSILSSEKYADAFIEFCVEQSAINSLYLWMDIQEYKEKTEELRKMDIKLRKPHKEQLFELGKQICSKFLQTDGEMSVLELNIINETILSSIERSLNEKVISGKLFDQVKEIIHSYLENRVLVNFLTSNGGIQFKKKNVSDVDRPNFVRAKNINSSTVSPKTSKEKLSSKTIILNAKIIDAEKLNGFDKLYLYEIDVSRKASDNTRIREIIYRSHQEFREAHIALLRFYCDNMDDFPNLPPAQPHIFCSGRSKDRVKELNSYLSKLFKMPSLNQSPIIQKFLEQSSSDLKRAGKEQINNSNNKGR